MGAAARRLRARIVRRVHVLEIDGAGAVQRFGILGFEPRPDESRAGRLDRDEHPATAIFRGILNEVAEHLVEVLPLDADLGLVAYPPGIKIIAHENNKKEQQAALAAGLVDNVADRRAFEARLAQLGGEDDNAPGGYHQIKLDSYIKDKVERTKSGPIGLVTIAGTIVDGNPDKVTGKAKYAAEFQVPNLAYGFVVSGSVAKGAIAAIDGGRFENEIVPVLHEEVLS